MRHWTEEEVGFLQQNGIDYSDNELKLMQPLIGRSKFSIKKKRIRLGLLKEAGTRRTEDEITIAGEHSRAVIDFPTPLGFCFVCEMEAVCSNCKEIDYARVSEAVDRARIDHSNLPYRKEFVLPMCRSHNLLHSANRFVILFQEEK